MVIHHQLVVRKAFVKVSHIHWLKQLLSVLYLCWMQLQCFWILWLPSSMWF